ncbi:hypothetical protein [Methylobacterium sp. J-092]|uniref:hypothetical protein n=1 Tax=Methylobacterium sp. J-092 TaxID=2836667 RepID=UPI001FB91F14|nr:hypothetical protein [Methylobacterium sp. J-092]MCJ2010439.1 hypothetical protein [Methylobacterium sp. J-092]
MPTLDRRVAVLSEVAGNDGSIRRVSDLRKFPFVVLLGEPGIGKSTVLEAEAAADGASVTRVRALLNGSRPQVSAGLYLDALDEYRIDGQAGDKIYQLAEVITRSPVDRWRLTCRSEDWRKEADIEAIHSTTGGTPIVVAQLLPLDYDEALTVLTELGEAEPEAFLDRALDFGAKGFTESPLSLKLLRAAVAEGEWPETRFDLFTSAIEQLSFERDRMRLAIPRHSRQAIISAAAQACLLMVASGAKSLWRSNDEPPRDQDRRAYVTLHDLAVDRNLLRDTLDTALFRGEGEAFEPMHKTLAEFLAGSALADAIRGSADRAALPLRRALALVATDDGAPPTELRGVFAWFAAHLARNGDETRAMHLIEADAATVLAYGDAAALGHIGRRALLANLDRRDPYFRATEVGVTAVSGLAGEDLVEDFRAILENRGDGTHLTFTVLEALTGGTPIESLRPTLWSLALDAARSESIRRRAIEAWLNGASDADLARRELFDALAAEPISIAREALRVYLAGQLPTAALPLADLKMVIADYERCGDDNTIGRLFILSQKLDIEPRGDLFDVPAPYWRPEMEHRKRRHEVDSLLDSALQAAIKADSTLSGDRLHRWLVGRWDYSWAQAGKSLQDTICKSFGRDPSREIAFFDAIIASLGPQDGPWVAGNKFRSLAGRSPSGAVVLHLFELSRIDQNKSSSHRSLSIATEIARAIENVDTAYWLIYDHLSQHEEFEDLLLRVRISEIKPWDIQRWSQHESKKLDENRTRSRNRTILEPLISELRAGRYPSILSRCAEIYWYTERDNRTNIDNLTYFTSNEIASAAVEGWKILATSGLNSAGVAALGIAKAHNRRKSAETAAMTGLVIISSEVGGLQSRFIPLISALSFLKSSYFLNDRNAREDVTRWAVKRLNEDANEGATHLVAYWEAAQDAGATDLDLISDLSIDAPCDGALRIALGSLLTTRPWLPPEALRTALCAIASLADLDWFRLTTTLALANDRVVGSQRIIWRYVSFAINPSYEEQAFLLEFGSDEEAQRLEHEINRHLVEALNIIDAKASTYREAAMVKLFGTLCTPADQIEDAGLSCFEGRSATVRAAIRALEGDASREAGLLLGRLIDEPCLKAWQSELRHAWAQHAVQFRDRNFRHPTPSAIRASVGGGPPVNASDLQAVVVEELRELRRELRIGDTMPWRQFWNRDYRGKVTIPLIENDCRDHILERLRDKLSRYQIAASIPEARRGDETRADILVLSHAGKNLPIEAKRHYHADIWTAASTQLQGYTASSGADGFGVYLVFWFGNEISPIPSRPDGSNGPNIADELERMLLDDLPHNIRIRTVVIVFDVSDPLPKKIVRPRKKRELKKEL